MALFRKRPPAGDREEARLADHIERTQRRAYDAVGRPLPDLDRARRRARQIATDLAAADPRLSARDREQVVRAELAALEATIAELPSRYENPLSYRIVLHLAERLRRAAADLLPDAPPWPRIATLHSGQVNAFTVRYEGLSRRVVFLDPDLFTYAHLLSKAVALAVPIERADAGGTGFALHDSAIDARIAAAPEPAQRLFELVEAYAVRGSAQAAPPYFAPAEYDVLHSGLTEGMELFVLAHEYAHVVLGHHGASPSPRRTPAGDLDEISYSWKQEFDADRLALPLAMGAGMERRDPAVTFAGISLFLGALELMDRAVSVLRTGRADERTLGSHPPSAQRRAALREHGLPQMLQRADWVAHATRVADATDFALDRLWTAVEPRVAELHRCGTAADPSWT